MNQVNQTLYIPLYGKAYVSRRGILLRDPSAEEIWEKEGFALKGKSRSKWLAFYMGMRAAVFDQWLKAKMQELPEAAVLHIGCGLDSRNQRVGEQNRLWFDLDFPDVIRERQRYFPATENYRMLASDVRDDGWLTEIPADRPLLVVMEGVSMYLTDGERKTLLKRLTARFPQVVLLTDCYTGFAARASKYKNPINDVGVTQVYGIDSPAELEEETGLVFVREHDMTPAELVEQLQGMERRVFRKVFAGSMAKKLYRLYELRWKKPENP